MGDAHGLFLLVQPAGGELWRLKYRLGGKEKKLAIGTYPEIGLGGARRRSERPRQTLDFEEIQGRGGVAKPTRPTSESAAFN